MPKAAEVISFPRDAGTTIFLREFEGNAAQRLDNVVERLSGIEAIVFGLKNSEVVPVSVQSIFAGIENALRDCIAVAELRPVGEIA